MATLDDQPMWVRAMLKLYRWRRVAPTPLATMTKPLSACRVALVTSAGLVAVGDTAFDETVRGGDWSYRVLRGDVDVASLGEFHRSASFDHSGIEADRNLAFPLDRLRELVADGTIGAVAPRHLSFMGSITAPNRLVQRSAPESAELLVNDEVDLALLVPV